MATVTNVKPQIRTSLGSRALVGKIILYIVLTIIAIFFLLPLLWMLVTALKPNAEWLQPNWIPQNPTFDNFNRLFSNPSAPVLNWFINSIGVSVVATLLTLMLDALAGYAYARLNFAGRNFLFTLMIATLTLPGIVFLVPNYLTMSTLGWLNTYQGVIAPGLAGVFGVFFLRQFFQSLPKELEEAVLIDGGNVWTNFWHIALPLSRPALATLGIITFLASWNDYLWPWLVLSDAERFTLPVGLASLQGSFTFDYGIIMAGAVIASVPVIALYLLLQRYIIQSVAMTGLKG
jgi:multiple sugar transport system permease protein